MRKPEFFDSGFLRYVLTVKGDTVFFTISPVFIGSS